jgi:uncharacterized protein YjiS (DUF1127 family)
MVQPYHTIYRKRNTRIILSLRSGKSRLIYLETSVSKEKPMSFRTLPSLPNAADFFVGQVQRRLTQAHLDFLATLALWRQRRRTRQHLSCLDDRQLADVGLNRTQQRVECAKAPWQL